MRKTEQAYLFPAGDELPLFTRVPDLAEAAVRQLEAQQAAEDRQAAEEAAYQAKQDARRQRCPYYNCPAGMLANRAAVIEHLHDAHGLAR